MNERDKFLTEEVLNECWHEWGWQHDTPKGHYKCILCHEIELDKNNNDFSTPEGFFKLWNAAKEKDWWMLFVTKAYDKVEFWGCLSFIEEIVHPDRFADAVYNFLKETTNEFN